MRVIITGGLGFLGRRLIAALDERVTLAARDGSQRPIEEVIAFDQADNDMPLKAASFDVRSARGEISDRQCVDDLIRSDERETSVFHLASVVSAQGEQDFDLAMRVNLDGGRNVFQALRDHGGGRLVFASSIVAFGGDAFIDGVGDFQKQLPQTTYGATKAICEILVNDHARKEHFDGRTARLPTVIIRPGTPNAAASSFASGIFREPLQGIDMVCPVEPGVRMPVAGYRSVVENLIRMHDLDAAQLGKDRAVGLPSRTVSVDDMRHAVLAWRERRALGRISMEVDPFINDLISGWAQDADCARALELGLQPAESLEEIIGYFVDDYLTKSEERVG